MENRAWLKSLPDHQLAEEIRYGRWLAESGRHRQDETRTLREAEEEWSNRRSSKSEGG